jgi:hypothetical protein
MATEEIRIATQHDLSARAERGATLGELLDHVGKRNRELGDSRFSDEQDDQLQLHCWAMYKRRSSGPHWGQTKTWRFLEEDMGG